MSKQLLITSDDFGMCHAVNTGITRAMTQGMVASTNFLAPAPWFSEAAALAKEHGLEVGVHLCLSCDWDRLKWGPITSNGRLREADGSFPALHVGLEKLGATDDDIYEELKAQILLVKAVYGEPSHLDTHMISGQWRGGIYDRVQKVIERLSKEFGLLYTYACDPRTQKLRHFVAEDCQTQNNQEQIFEILRGWTGEGRYHLYGHAAEDSLELNSVCSPGHPSRNWTGECRIRDLAFYLNRDNVTRIKDLGFELIKVSALKS